MQLLEKFEQFKRKARGMPKIMCRQSAVGGNINSAWDTKAESEGRHLDDTVPYLSVYLGHDSLNETEKYLKFGNELFPESIDAFGEFMSGLLPEVDYEA